MGNIDIPCTTKQHRSISDEIRGFINARPTLRRALTPVAIVSRRVFPSQIYLAAKAYDYLFESAIGGSLKVRIPEFSGVFSLDCHSHILRTLLVRREFEPNVSRLVRRVIDPGKDAIDVGANVGLYTVLLSSLLRETQKVLAIEPIPANLSRLEENIRENNYPSSVLLFKGAATESAGSFSLNVISGLEEYSSLLKIQDTFKNGRECSQIPVCGETIDNLVQRYNLNPGFMKLDTEGTEIQVLRGASTTLEKFRPMILFELFVDKDLAAVGGEPGAMFRYLHGRQYRIWKCEDGEFLAVPSEADPQAFAHMEEVK
jgi:FkbM family methyltransferase